MAKFKDNTDAEWVLSVDVVVRKQIKAEFGIDIFDAVTGKLYLRLATEPEDLVNVLWGLCAGQARERGIDPTAFARLIVGDVIESATVALLEAIADFFPKGQRTWMTSALAKVKELSVEMNQQADQAVKNIDVKSLLLKKSNGSTGDAQASSESTRLPAD